MRSCSKSETRRCRPLLGTFVEITATGPDGAVPDETLDRAFGAIERIESLMSAHRDTSELSRVNACAFLRPVTVSEETFQVLQHGLEVARVSDGAFDFTVAPALARWGYLPRHLRRRTQGHWRDVMLERGRRVRFARPLAIDLGGIAKGYAVDAAIASLRSDRVVSASVNAGGDLRVFGPGNFQVHLRHPITAEPLANPMLLHDGALATSSPCFTQRQWRGRAVSHLVAPGSGRPILGGVSVSVRAADCWLADALTKVVLNSPALRAARLLERFQCEAFVIHA